MNCSRCLINPVWSVHGSKVAKLCLDCKGFFYKYTGISRTRELARIRDKQSCQDCKKVWMEGQRKFDIHHLNGLCGKRSQSYDKVTDMEGLITLCHKCHFNRTDHTYGIRQN